MEGKDAAGMSSCDVGHSDTLQKEINRREAFERKNAELEGVNDKLRLENGVSHECSFNMACWSDCLPSLMIIIIMAMYC